MKQAITERLVSKHKQVTPSGASAAKDPPIETSGWATYVKKVPIEAKRADKGGTLRTLEGPARYRAGDLIARGAKGEKWPIRSDVFGKTYKKVGPAHGTKEAEKVPSFGVFSPRAAGQIGSKAKKRIARTKVAFRIRGRFVDEATAPTRKMIEWFKTKDGRRALLGGLGIALLSTGGVAFLDRLQNESLHQHDTYPG